MVISWECHGNLMGRQYKQDDFALSENRVYKIEQPLYCIIVMIVVHYQGYAIFRQTQMEQWNSWESMGFSKPNIGFVMGVLKKMGQLTLYEIGMDQKHRYNLPCSFFWDDHIHCQRFSGEQKGTRALTQTHMTWSFRVILARFDG